jgi:tight adherence protein C
MPLIIPILVFVFVFLVITGIYWLVFNKPSIANDRLQSLNQDGAEELPAPNDSSVERIAELIAEPINRLVPPSAAEAGKLQKKLMHAGYRAANAVMIYRAIQLICLVGIPLVTVLVLMALARPLMDNWTYLTMSVLSGYLLPRYYLDRQVSKRQLKLQWGMADALDLLVVAIEAGLGMNQAMVKVSSELRSAHPEISEEFELVNSEIRVGREREVALRNLADRTGVDDLRGLCAMLIQADRFGTSIARAVRVYSDSLRTKRRQRAEQAAQKAAVKLLIPLALFLFPTLFIAMLGPAAIQLLDNFINK